ncbi:SH3 domain-containing protein [Lachnotalea glycerini]|uniref:SH3 domain-containing protein n=1 Tax=Lachnotalea glycerini TaxID=1763509 RepID=A0A318EUF8_9FIRM|nr:SH3 domain-containing protein [Lachnotalea glycerini]OYO76069.1 hypothetical protein CG709_16455 [Lachnotalea glycerini]PXV88414.1 SH3 domain-containing protein [Lachnotalea glycerini]
MKTKKLITSLLLCAMILTSSLPLTVNAATLSTTKKQASVSKTSSTSVSKWIVTASSLNIRSGPGTNYQTTGSLKKYDYIETYEKSGSWYHLTSKYGSGWVHGDYLLTYGA